MEVLVNASHVLLPILYTVLVIGYGRLFARGPSGIARLTRQFLLGTVTVHLASILLVSAMRGACPLGSPAEFLSLMAFSIAVIYLIIELRSGEKTLGVFAITPAFVLQLIAAIGILSGEEPSEVRLGLQASLHVFAAVVGFAAVALANVYSILYLFLYAAIKRGRFGLFFKKMPSLENLSKLNLDGLSTAFAALTVNVAIGLWEYVGSGARAVEITDPVVLMTLLVWLLYGVCLVGNQWLQLGGKRLAVVTLVGIPFLVAIFVGELVTRGGFHG